MVQFNKNEAFSIFIRLSLESANWNKFEEHFAYPLIANSSVNEVTETFYNSVVSAIKAAIPLKTRRTTLAPISVLLNPSL